MIECVAKCIKLLLLSSMYSDVRLQKSEICGQIHYQSFFEDRK